MEKMKIILFFLAYLIFSIVPAWGKNLIATEENWRLSSNNNLTIEGSIPLFDSTLESRGMAITADGLHAYGTSFISMWPPEQGGFIRWYRINPKDGSLTSQGVMLVNDVPTGIALSPNGQYAYVSTVNGYVKRYQINQNFSLTYIDQARHSSDHWTGGIAISPNGHAIYTAVIAGWDGGYINYFKINEDGSLTFQRSVHVNEGHRTGVCVSPNGKFIYSSGEWGINWYAVNADGSLSYRGNARGSKEYVYYD
jgi:6-phosphogluconolactonase (cycloisomerase 2 family)